MLDRREYAVVLDRLEEGPALSSSSKSGAARFFPLWSLTGSLIDKGAVVADVLRRIRLTEREGSSSEISLPFPFPIAASRLRFCFAEPVVARLRVAAVVAVVSVDGAEEDADGCWSISFTSRSFPFPLDFDFCLAAFTLALERKAFDSVGNESWGAVDALELLVASC